MLSVVQMAQEGRVVDDKVLTKNIERLRAGVEWCRARELSVMVADIVGSKPKILIETSAKCMRLVADGLAAEIGSQSSGGVYSRVMCVVAEECQIMWVERGH